MPTPCLTLFLPHSLPASLVACLSPPGVWDVMDPREVVNRVMDTLSEGKGAACAARQLVEDAIALAEGSPSGDADNTSGERAGLVRRGARGLGSSD